MKGSVRLIFFPGFYGGINITVHYIDDLLRSEGESPHYSFANGDPSRVIIDNVGDAYALALILRCASWIQRYP